MDLSALGAALRQRPPDNPNNIQSAFASQTGQFMPTTPQNPATDFGQPVPVPPLPNMGPMPSQTDVVGSQIGSQLSGLLPILGLAGVAALAGRARRPALPETPTGTTPMAGSLERGSQFRNAPRPTGLQSVLQAVPGALETYAGMKKLELEQQQVATQHQQLLWERANQEKQNKMEAVKALIPAREGNLIGDDVWENLVSDPSLEGTPYHNLGLKPSPYGAAMLLPGYFRGGYGQDIRTQYDLNQKDGWKQTPAGMKYPAEGMLAQQALTKPDKWMGDATRQAAAKLIYVDPSDPAALENAKNDFQNARSADWNNYNGLQHERAQHFDQRGLPTAALIAKMNSLGVTVNPKIPLSLDEQQTFINASAAKKMSDLTLQDQKNIVAYHARMLAADPLHTYYDPAKNQKVVDQITSRWSTNAQGGGAASTGGAAAAGQQRLTQEEIDGYRKAYPTAAAFRSAYRKAKGADPDPSYVNIIYGG